jgi:predicted transcriptional regulator
MNKIQEFTEAFEITDHEASKILGVSSGAISNWRSARHEIPDYIERSIDLHLSLPKAHQKRIKEYRL